MIEEILYYCHMMRNKKTLRLLLVALLLIWQNMSEAQICAEVRVSGLQLMKGVPFAATVVVNNMPANAVLKVTVNKKANADHGGFQHSDYLVNINGNEAGISSIDTVIGHYLAYIDIEVVRNEKVVYKEQKALGYDVLMPDMAIEAFNRDYIYDGVENKIRIVVPGIMPHQMLLFTGIGGRLKRLGTNDYSIHYDKSAAMKSDPGIKVHEATITISARMPDGTTRRVAVKKFRVLDFPPVVCSLDKPFGSIKASDSSLQIMAVVPPDLENLVEPLFQSYTCRIWSNNQWETYSFYGHTIGGELLTQIKTMKPGDMLYFDVRVKWVNLQSPGPTHFMSASFAVPKS
jgi:hypothetical protein